MSHTDAVQAEDSLNEIEEYLNGRQDVLDGDDGRPKPNRAMQLLTEIERLRAFVRSTTQASAPSARAVATALATLEWLDRQGGLGANKHTYIRAAIDGLKSASLPSETPRGDTAKGEWRVEHHNESLGMLVAPSGRVFRLQELGVQGKQWGNPDDNEQLCEHIAAALRSNGGSAKVPEGCVDCMKEAAAVLSGEAPAREPLADELYGFAAMLSAAPTSEEQRK